MIYRLKLYNTVTKEVKYKDLFEGTQQEADDFLTDLWNKHVMLVPDRGWKATIHQGVKGGSAIVTMSG